jgi:hypothetical protein
MESTNDILNRKHEHSKGEKKIPSCSVPIYGGFLDNFSPLFWAHHHSSTFPFKEEK